MFRPAYISLGIYIALLHSAMAQFPDEIRKHFDEHAIGSWVNETTWGQQRITGHSTSSWDESRTTIRTVGAATDSKGQLQTSETLGWDAANKEVVVHYFDSRGNALTVRWKPSKANDLTDWMGTGSGTYDGKRWESATKLRFGTDEQRYEDITEGLPFVVISKRKEKASNPPSTEMPQLVRRTIDEQLIGKFSGKGTYDGQEFSTAHSFQWDATQTSIQCQSTEMGTKGMRKTTGLIGWSPSDHAVIHIGFSDQGGQFTIRWTEFTPTVWRGHISGMLNGQSYSEAPAKVEFRKDSFTYEDTAIGKQWLETFTRK